MIFGFEFKYNNISFLALSRCRPGHFALSHDDECTACDCNGHIDVRDLNSCDANTGVCLLCLHNTTGDHCEHCVPGTYLDQSSTCQGIASNKTAFTNLYEEFSFHMSKS